MNKIEIHEFILSQFLIRRKSSFMKIPHRGTALAQSQGSGGKMTKMTLTFAVFVAFAMVLSSCNKTSNGETATTPAAEAPVDTTSPGQPKVNTASVSTEQTRIFYSQFIYRLEGDCRKPETRPFRSITNVAPMMIEKGRNGRDLAVHLLLNLYENGTYSGVYSEALVLPSSPNDNRYKTQFHSNVEGRWLIRQNQIFLEGLGSGIPLIENGSVANKILFKITRQLNHNEILNSIVPLELVKSSFGDCR
jgi:preprotein translocase subunit SecG